MSSPYFENVLQAYTRFSGSESLASFFNALAHRTGKILQRNDHSYGREPISFLFHIFSRALSPPTFWANRYIGLYPDNIHLAFLYFMEIASTNLPFIEAWHKPLTPETRSIMGKERRHVRVGMAFNSSYGIPVAINNHTVVNIHPDFTKDEWDQLWSIVENIAKREALSVRSERSIRRMKLIEELEQKIREMPSTTQDRIDTLWSEIEKQINRINSGYNQDNEIQKLQQLQQEYLILTQPYREIVELWDEERNDVIE
jgi:hypothetical protein